MSLKTRLFAALLLSSYFVAATQLQGDGAYALYAYDSVVANNGFVVYLDALEPFGAPTTAYFTVSYGGQTVEHVGLGAGGEKTVRSSGNEVTISVSEIDWTGNENNKYWFAGTRVESLGDAVGITFVSAVAGESNATIEWKTSQAANGSVTVRRVSDPWNDFQIVSQQFFSTEQRAYVNGLKSNTNYSFVISVCTPQVRCAQSQTGYFKTFPNSPAIYNIKIGNITNQSALIGWYTDVPAHSAKITYRELGERNWTEAIAPGNVSETTHLVQLSGLSDKTKYRFLITSCSEGCAVTGEQEFETLETFVFQPPKVEFVSYPQDAVEHGSSVIFVVKAEAKTKGAGIRRAVLEWDDGGRKTLELKFGGHEFSLVSRDFPHLAAASITFSKPGQYDITLKATDTGGLSANTTLFVDVKSNPACGGTSAKYYPSDTGCRYAWPHGGGRTVDYNTEWGACDLFEVCDASIDYMVADAETCCNGELAFSDKPRQGNLILRGFQMDAKRGACRIAVGEATAGARINMSAASKMKFCRASYLVHAIGSEAIYMQDYYMGEVCCAADSLCKEKGYERYYYTTKPHPVSNIQFDSLVCYFYNVGGVRWRAEGWYNSDYDPDENNNALVDIPAHASVNRMNTGTCADYSVVVTTALRKAGFGKGQVYSAGLPRHLINLIKLPGEEKFRITDTTGNTGGDFAADAATKWINAGGTKFARCDYASNECSNDGGYYYCPKKSAVQGCSN
ncbi:MAG: fibronectin type III domain-containing protein [Candidatus Micrarchaeota archaeon]